MPLTRASPCVGNLPEDSGSEEYALVLFVSSLLAASSDPRQALQLLEDLSIRIDAAECRLFEHNRKGLRTACLLRLQLGDGCGERLGLDAGNEPLILSGCTWTCPIVLSRASELLRPERRFARWIAG